MYQIKEVCVSWIEFFLILKAVDVLCREFEKNGWLIVSEFYYYKVVVYLKKKTNALKLAKR